VATHIVHVLQVESVQHICSHFAALPGPPCSVQLWKHIKPLEHCESERQPIVSWQQFPTMHWLHGVPPGSSVQLPASTAIPQWALAHTRPTQHCGDIVQLEPGGRHIPEPQIPFWHTMLQHSVACMQVKPSSLHMFIPQIPPLHTVLQHSLGTLHAKPSGVHIPKPHVLLFGLQKPVQHWLSVEHGVPSGMHMMGSQMPVTGLQELLQQAESVLQTAPSGLQFGPHVDWALQTPLQHGAPPVHGAPS
jgi:hypothetical protein